jgi:hypothetical protein
MSGVEPLDVALTLAHGPALGRVRELMRQVKPADLSPQEILALLAILEAANQRIGTHTASVLRLVPRDSGVRQP